MRRKGHSPNLAIEKNLNLDPATIQISRDRKISLLSVVALTSQTSEGSFYKHGWINLDK